MPANFDSSVIIDNGWRQGAVLNHEQTIEALKSDPKSQQISDDEWLVVMSHDCDIANFRLENEPKIEVLRVSVISAVAAIKGGEPAGRHPRELHLKESSNEGEKSLRCSIHDRWLVSREILLKGVPHHCLTDKNRRIAAEWLAKRYIRAAFPSAFDIRWRGKMKPWRKLLNKHSDWLQGVYLRLSTLEELIEDEPYKCLFILAVPSGKVGGTEWAAKKEELERDVVKFWSQFKPRIVCTEAEALGTDEITLDDISRYQRFDADWISYEDGL